MPVGNPRPGEHWVRIFGGHIVHIIIGRNFAQVQHSKSPAGTWHISSNPTSEFLMRFAYLGDLTGRWFQQNRFDTPVVITNGWLQRDGKIFVQYRPYRPLYGTFLGEAQIHEFLEQHVEVNCPPKDDSLPEEVWALVSPGTTNVKTIWERLLEETE